MVSTTSIQYITDFSSNPAEPGKSPLAMLAKTCETIGLPGVLSKSNTCADTKEDKRPDHQMKQKSPRSTPSSREPTMTFPGLMKPAYTVGMPGMSFPLFNPMFPYQMPFSTFSLNPAALIEASRLIQCPFSVMQQPCANLSCVQCSTKRSGASACVNPPAVQMTPELMAQFSSHPLFPMYANMLPSNAGASDPYNHLSVTTPFTLSSPKELKASNFQKRKCAETIAPKVTNFECNWIELDTVCGKTFAEEFELSNHFKKEHSTSQSSKFAEKDQHSRSRTRKLSSRSNATPDRFNPYKKCPMPARSSSVIPSISVTPVMFPFSLQSSYVNRLLSPIAHQ